LALPLCLAQHTQAMMKEKRNYASLFHNVT